jgi:LmbE family N-acetylglucosaminyl deacetylase
VQIVGEDCCFGVGVRVVLFEPHYDDAVLFASYTLLRERPLVLTVYGHMCVQEHKHGIRSDQRRTETTHALSTLGSSHDWWQIPENATYEKSPDSRDEIVKAMASLEWPDPPETVWAPMPEEENGHSQHDAVGHAAVTVFGDRVRFYATYRRGSGRTRTMKETRPEPDWPAMKFNAMAYYRSQINLPDCQPWFAAADMLREWTA